jgi:hypothetical protein
MLTNSGSYAIRLVRLQSPTVALGRRTENEKQDEHEREEQRRYDDFF